MAAARKHFGKEMPSSVTDPLPDGRAIVMGDEAWERLAALVSWLAMKVATGGDVGTHRAGAALVDPGVVPSQVQSTDSSARRQSAVPHAGARKQLWRRAKQLLAEPDPKAAVGGIISLVEDTFDVPSALLSADGLLVGDRLSTLSLLTHLFHYSPALHFTDTGMETYANRVVQLTEQLSETQQKMDLSFEDAAMERRALTLNGLQTAGRKTEDRGFKFEDWAVDKALSLNAELLGAASDVATVGGVVTDESCRALTGHVEWSHAARSVSSGFLREYTTMNAPPPLVGAVEKRITEEVSAFARIDHRSLTDLLRSESEDEAKAICLVLSEHSLLLRNIYKAYSAMGNVSGQVSMDMGEWRNFISDINVETSDFTTAKVDICFVEASLVDGKTKEKALIPQQFTEAIVRLAHGKFNGIKGGASGAKVGGKGGKPLSDYVVKLFGQHLLPYAEKVSFRDAVESVRSSKCQWRLQHTIAYSPWCPSYLRVLFLSTELRGRVPEKDCSP